MFLDDLESTKVSFGNEIINGIVTSNRDLRQIVEHTIKPVTIYRDLRQIVSVVPERPVR